MENTSLSFWRIFCIIILEGFVTISVEVLAIRQLTPKVGNSVIVVSLIIGIFLLCLAYGYQAGGRQTKHLIPLLRRNFLIAAVGIGLGLSYIFIEYFFWIVHHTFHIPLLWTLIIYLSLIIAPIVYCLGQTVPITMHLIPQQQSAGTLGGKVLHLSTLGSFLGAILTSLLLMTFLGVAWTLFTNFIILIALVMLITRENLPIYSVGFFMLSGWIYLIAVSPEKTAMLDSTPYANYVMAPHVKLTNGQVGTLFSINDSQSSFIDDQKKAFPYIERIKQILFHNLQLTNKDILVLGAGGFTLSAENTFGNRFTYVDIDPAIHKTVTQNFLKHINGIFVAADARHYVKEHPNSYDVIISDIYSNNFTIPSHLLTREYFTSLKHALKPNGIVAVNIIASPLLNTPYAKRVDNTLRAVFKSCTVNPLWSHQNSSENIIYICQNNHEADDNTVYSDNLSQASLDAFIQMQ